MTDPPREVNPNLFDKASRNWRLDCVCSNALHCFLDTDSCSRPLSVADPETRGRTDRTSESHKSSSRQAGARLCAAHWYWTLLARKQPGHFIMWLAINHQTVLPFAQRKALILNSKPFAEREATILEDEPRKSRPRRGKRDPSPCAKAVCKPRGINRRRGDFVQGQETLLLIWNPAFRIRASGSLLPAIAGVNLPH